ncbi:MAG: hypothetical protein JWN95_490 [Frankiales bacterium]|nr:hypothetical protein [Frankiales bacterium]
MSDPKPPSVGGVPEIPPLIQPILHFDRLAARTSSLWSGMAELTIWPGLIGARLEKSLTGVFKDEPPLFHRDKRITINLSRFPPWYDTALILNTEQGKVLIGMDRYRRKKLLVALRNAGFEVTVQRRSLLTLYRL